MAYQCKQISDSVYRGSVYIFSLILVFLAFICLSPVQGQISSLKIGDRIKITVPSMSKWPIVGKVDTISNSTLRLYSDKKNLVIPLSAIDKMKVSHGKRKARPEGAILGTAAGLFISLQFTKSYKDCQGLSCIGRLYNYLIVPGGIFGGAAAGVLVGSLFEVEIWKPIRLKADLTVTNNNYRTNTFPSLSIKWTM
ncbi:hypothetical protein NC796_04840 [Aliifodinibius sp. S!AR15-10]|nr:hypothetical protein [Aliifodinibius sp. S!AR15-10]